jgi:hypothetical protein
MLFVLSAVIWWSPVHVIAQQISKPEEIEWTWEVRPVHADPTLPNVLLLGDSITRNYYPEVKKQLDKVANVYLMSSSTSVGDPRLPLQVKEFAAMENVSFKVIHFNNGMHGWEYSEAEYKAAFPSFLNAVRQINPSASLIWATTTPVKEDILPGPTNARVVARNVIANRLAQQDGISIDRQHALMLHHADQYQDKVHFNPAGATIQGDQAARMIREALEKQK